MASNVEVNSKALKQTAKFADADDTPLCHDTGDHLQRSDCNTRDLRNALPAITITASYTTFIEIFVVSTFRRLLCDRPTGVTSQVVTLGLALK
jgi:hypothetical protein